MTEEFEDKQKKIREKKAAKIMAMPTIAMCEWSQSDDMKDGVDYCSQVIKLTKRSVTMRTLQGKGGTVTLTSKDGPITDMVKIIPLPCDTRQWAQLRGYGRKYFPSPKEEKCISTP